MLKSMTGYGRTQLSFPERNILVELKSVNHRFFECSSRVPRNCGFLEEKLKGYFQAAVSRGKVECFVQIEALTQTDSQVCVNHALVSGYITALREIAECYHLPEDCGASVFSRFPDVFVLQKQEPDAKQIWEQVREAAQAALEQFLAMREAEGKKLREDILSRMEHIKQDIAFVEERSPETVREYNAKLSARMRELLEGASVDEQRLLTESAIFADKIAVAEETVRLRSHLDQLQGFLDGGETAVGRKMDFLVQEINREANTIGSKAQDVEIARRVVNIKSEIEKIREQVQNIE